jgi:uncharacterized protein (TIGR02246 family)
MRPDLDQVKELHARILDAWNRQDAAGYAEQFTETALVVGFDGSEMHGRDEVAAQLDAIFSDHKVASYVRIVREVRELGDAAALLHAVVGMVPPGGGDLMPDRNAVQVLIAVRVGEAWLAEIFQNTPARLDGRPEALEALTDELRAARGAD